MAAMPNGEKTFRTSEDEKMESRKMSASSRLF